MGSSQSGLVQHDEVPSHVQRDNLFCCQICIPGSPSIGLFTEPARFNEPKPWGLTVTDDTWAALKLRVDPLARDILDPHRSYVGAAFLSLLMAAVFTAVRPGWHIVDLSSYYHKDDSSGGNYDGDGSGDGEGEPGAEEQDDDDQLDQFYDRDRDDDFYNYEGDGFDDIVLAELEYRNEEIYRQMIFWRIGFIASLSILLLATVTVAVGMELRNARYDAKIHAVCDEMKKRFEDEGFTIGYRTRTEISGVLFGHLRPQRVIVFKRKDDYVPPGSPEGGTGDGGRPNSSRCEKTLRAARERGGETVLVEVPEGRRPGQLVTVLTPAGDHVMVAIPRGARPGQSFPVLIPPKAPSSTVSSPALSQGVGGSGSFGSGGLKPARGAGGGGPREFEMV